MRKDLIAIIFPVIILTAHSKSTNQKELLTNILQNRSDDIKNNTQNPVTYKATEIISKAKENVLNNIQSQNFTQNGNYTDFNEKLAGYKVNMTILKKHNVQDGVPPTMIPIFRPIQNNYKSKLLNELRNTKNISTDDTNENKDNNSTVTVSNEATIDVTVNISNGIEMFKHILNISKQQHSNVDSQQKGGNIEVDTITGKVQETVKNNSEIINLLDILYPNNDNVKCILNGQDVTENCGNNMTEVRVSNPKQSNIIVNSNKVTSSLNNKYSLAPYENFKECNVIKKIVKETLAKLPNNVIIESMNFIPYNEEKRIIMDRNIPNIVTQNANIEEKLSEKPVFEESTKGGYKEQTNTVNNARFNIPCFTAADILGDLGTYEYNPVNQNSVKPNMNFKTDKIVSNVLFLDDLVAYNQNSVKPNVNRITDIIVSNMQYNVVESKDESLAIIFKPKNISLLKLYGDILKKITLTVLVPYHVSKLTA